MYDWNISHSLCHAVQLTAHCHHIDHIQFNKMREKRRGKKCRNTQSLPMPKISLETAVYQKISFSDDLYP